MGDLKPCPFCGAEATVGETQDGNWIAGCPDEDGCSACPTVDKDSRADAIAAWNTRMVDGATLAPCTQPEGHAGWLDCPTHGADLRAFAAREEIA